MASSTPIDSALTEEGDQGRPLGVQVLSELGHRRQAQDDGFLPLDREYNYTWRSDVWLFEDSSEGSAHRQPVLRPRSDSDDLDLSPLPAPLMMRTSSSDALQANAQPQGRSVDADQSHSIDQQKSLRAKKPESYSDVPADDVLQNDQSAAKLPRSETVWSKLSRWSDEYDKFPDAQDNNLPHGTSQDDPRQAQVQVDFSPTKSDYASSESVPEAHASAQGSSFAVGLSSPTHGHLQRPASDEQDSADPLRTALKQVMDLRQQLEIAAQAIQERDREILRLRRLLASEPGARTAPRRPSKIAQNALTQPSSRQAASEYDRAHNLVDTDSADSDDLEEGLELPARYIFRAPIYDHNSPEQRIVPWKRPSIPPTRSRDAV
jgi:hypothetical protein